MSISSTFYARIFRQYFGAKNYKAETFGFETFWRKDIGKKFSSKMLKLTADVIKTSYTNSKKIVEGYEEMFASLRRANSIIYNKARS